ncbi:hypothetical protein [Phycicoccus sp. 3266]|jgi:hypothetical protein|uniref:hypothetical protein n=1 Tax=Phycicoccus sp. 3266 TaxID=2817751 RepID=UPI00286146CB|nr:hypothetical protein [Phycicoccus sp. 3266]MDR6861726.1 hypothetical protein [Phycicoccus sp. 3266]
MTAEKDDRTSKGTTTDETATRERIDALQAEIVGLRMELARTRIEQWAGRLDDLELQYHLGRMEADERLSAALADVRHRIAKARARAENRGEAAEEAVEAITSGVEHAFDDLRQAMVRARDAVTH